MKNSELLHLLFEVIEEMTGEKVDEGLITYVPDRLGHDFRYALDGSKVEALGYRPMWPLKAGLKETVQAMKKVFV